MYLFAFVYHNYLVQQVFYKHSSNVQHVVVLEIHVIYLLNFLLTFKGLFFHANEEGFMH